MSIPRSHPDPIIAVSRLRVFETLPPCGCVSRETPCEHVRAAARKLLGCPAPDWLVLDRCWADALRHYLDEADDSYRDRPTPPERADALPGSEAKIEVLSARFAAGLGLWRDDDAVRVPRGMVRDLHRGANGSVFLGPTRPEKAHLLNTLHPDTDDEEADL